MFGRFKEPVRGWATVQQLGSGPSARVSITVAGMEPYEVALDDGDLKHRWPPVGTQLPVEVDARRPRRVRIVWDEVGVLPTEPSQLSPQQVYGSAIGGPAVPTTGPGSVTSTQVHVVGGDPSDPRVQDAVRLAEGVMGVDLDGDGQVAPTQPGHEQAAQAFQAMSGGPFGVAGPPVAGRAPTAGSRVDRLTQLAALHRDGAITDDELERLKAELLAEP